MTVLKVISVYVGVGILVGAAILALFALPEFATTKGRYDQSAFWFPYTFLTFHVASSLEISFPFRFNSNAVIFAFMLAQFPTYGLLYGWARIKHREARAAIWLLATHLVLGISSSVLYRIDYLVSRGISPF